MLKRFVPVSFMNKDMSCSVILLQGTLPNFKFRILNIDNLLKLLFTLYIV